MKINHICPFIKTYHLKTVFLHFMESKTEDYWKRVSIWEALTKLVNELITCLKNKECKHFFIDFINILDEKTLKINYSQVEKRIKMAIKILEKVENEKNKASLILETNQMVKLDIDDILMLKSSIQVLVCLLFLTSFFLILTVFVYIVSIAFILFSLVSWLISFVFSIPIIILFVLVFYIVGRCFSRN